MKVKFFNNFEQHTRFLGKELLFSNGRIFFGDWGAH